MPEKIIKKKRLIFTIEYSVEVESNMTINLDEALEIMTQYGGAEIVDARIE